MRPFSFRFILFAAFSLSLQAGDLLAVAERLASQNLQYIYGSEDPAKGGLDCSGFVRVVFREAYGIDLPDEAGKQYDYARKYGRVWDGTTGVWKESDLKPGDLVFYSGTRPSQRLNPITHVMIYYGHGLVVGAQNAGHRLYFKSPGVGFFPFRPHPPCGDPAHYADWDRSKMRLFAYARLYPAAKVAQAEIPKPNGP